MKLRVTNLDKEFWPYANLFRSLSVTLFETIRNNPKYKRSVFHNVNFEVGNGECVAVVGKNGSGKSTLLRCISGITRPTKGKIEKFGRTVSLLTHGFGNYEDLSTESNIVLAQQLFGLRLKEAKKNVGEIAKLAGLEMRLKSATSQLSEGMRAKVALCCLPFVPFDLLLLDESLNHVDEEFRDFFLGLTRNWIKEGRSILLTSHEPSLVERFATRKLLLQDKALISLH